MNKRTIELEHVWDGKTMQTVELTPEQGSAVLIGYSLDSPEGEDGPFLKVAEALAQSLVEQGTVAGRWFDEDVSGFPEATLWPAPSRNPVQRIWERMRDTWPSPVVTTRSASTVMELLDRGWDLQYQALLLLDTNRSADAAEAVRELSVRRDWRDFSFAEPVRALVVPGVDGAFVLMAAASKDRLADVLDSLAKSFREAGFEIVHQAGC